MAAQHGRPGGDDSEEEELPQWARSFHNPYKGGYKVALPSSSSDSDGVLDLTGADRPAGMALSQPDPEPMEHEQLQSQAPVIPSSQPQLKPTPASTSKAGGRGAGRGAKQPPSAEQPPAPGTQTQAGASQPGPPIAKAALKPVQRSAKAVTAVAERDDDDVIIVSDSQPPASQAPEDGEDSKPNTQPHPRSRLGAASQAPLPPGADLPIMLPERVPRNKVLLELCGGGRHEDTVDLAGDAGVVGRLITNLSTTDGSLSAPSHPMVVDLKGVVFSARVVPLAGTAMVLHLHANEARVEALMHDYIQLCDPDAGGSLEEVEGEAGLGALLGSDDEGHYNIPGGEGEEAGEGGKTTGKKAKRGEGASKSKAGGRGAGKGAGAKASKGGKASKGVGKATGVKRPRAGGKGGADKPKAKRAKKQQANSDSE